MPKFIAGDLVVRYTTEQVTDSHWPKAMAEAAKPVGGFSVVACGVSALDNTNRHQNDCVVGDYRTVMVRVVFIGAPETSRPIQP